MPKIAVVGDVHLSDKAPGARKDTWAQDILDKLTFIGEEAVKRGATDALVLGDTFHVKTASRTSHELVQRTHEVLKSTGIPWHFVVGNHDEANDRLDSIPSQPLGTLTRMQDMSLLLGPDANPDLPIYGIEYLADLTTLPKRLDKFMKWVSTTYPDTTQPVLLGLHAPIFPDSKTPPYEHIHASDVAVMLKRCKNPVTVAYGHIHDPEGHWTTPEAPNVTFANYGGISRGSLHTETMKRKPQFYVWDSDTGDIDPIDIPVKPVEDVFNLSEVEAQAAQAERMTDFLKSVSSENLQAFDSIDDLLKQIDAERDSTEVTDDVFKVVLELIEHAKSA